MSGSHLCIPRNETVPRPYFLKRITMFYLPIPTEIYIFPGSVCLFCCRQICRAILGIYKSVGDGKLVNLFLQCMHTDLGALEWDELGPEGGGDGEEGDGEPADEVCEHEESHPLRDLRVVRVPGLRAANGPVHLRRQKIRLAVKIEYQALQWKWI